MSLKRYRRGEPFGRRGLDGRTYLDRAAADWLNELATRIERASRLRGGPGVNLYQSANGRQIVPGRMGSILARLTSNSNPYSWVEVYPEADGTHTNYTSPRAGTANAFEVQGRGGLQDQVVWIRKGAREDYRFQYVRRGEAVPCLTTLDVTVTVTECNSAPLPGATVTLKDSGGNTLDTCTTDADGQCSLDITGLGSYTVMVEMDGFEAPEPQEVTFAACAPQAVAFDLTFNFDSGPDLIPCCCGPGIDKQLILVPRTLNGTLGGQTITLTYDSSITSGTSTPGGWFGCATFSGTALVWDGTTDGLGGCRVAETAGQAIPVGIFYTCDGTVQMVIPIYSEPGAGIIRLGMPFSCADLRTNPGCSGSYNTLGVGGPTSLISYSRTCEPLSVSGAFDMSTSPMIYFDGFDGSFTITE